MLPREFLRLLLERLVMQMAATSRLLSPLSLDDLVDVVVEHLDLYGLGGEDGQSEVTGILFLIKTGHNNEWTLSRLVEGIQSGNVVVLEV